MFLVIKMYPREGPDSNITNYTHAKAGMAKEASSHTPFQFFTSGDLSSLGPSVLLVHQPLLASFPSLLS